MPSNFEYISKVGGTSSGTGQLTFNAPRGIATDGKYIWVADTGNHRIKKLRLQGLSFISHWGDLNVSTGLPTSGSGDTGFSSPDDILYYDGVLFISDRGNNRVKIHRATDGLFLKAITGLSSPRGMANDRKYLWVVNSGASQVIKYDIPTLTAVETMGSAGSGDGQLNTPLGIEYDVSDMAIYISDFGNTRVQKWDAHGGTFRGKITGLTDPIGVMINNHELYVLVDTSIKVYAAATLALQSTGGSVGTDNDEITGGAYIIFHEDMLLFTDYALNRLVVWNSYTPRRAYDSGGEIPIPGDEPFYDIPTVPIGEEQGGSPITIGGSAASDLLTWIEEQPVRNQVAWVRE